MTKVSGIYKITSPTGKIYIGQSVNVYGRFKEYKWRKGKRQTKLYSSFVSHGIDNHNFELIEECGVGLLNERECFYISKYNSFNTEHGMNLTTGGGAKGKVSDETKIKIGIANLGKQVSKESKKRMSDSQQKRSAEISKLISKRNIGNQYAKGRKLTLEEIDKLKESKKGKPAPMQGKKHSPQSIEKMRLAKLGKKKNHLLERKY